MSICRRHLTGFSGLMYKAFILYLLCRVEVGAEEKDFGHWYWKEETNGTLKLEFSIGNIWYWSGFSMWNVIVFWSAGPLGLLRHGGGAILPLHDPMSFTER